MRSAHRFRSVVPLAAFAYLLAASFEAPGAAPADAVTAASVDARMAQYAALVDRAVAGGVAGVQVCARAGGREWSRAAGLSSVERRTPMTEATRPRGASITKLLTYAVTTEFVKAGRLRLDDRIVPLLPRGTLDGARHAELMTVQQLLDHQSGIHNFNGEHGDDFFRDLYSDPRFGRRLWKLDELVAYARKREHAPNGEPGKGTWYSSTGYILLQMIIERLSGKPMHRLYRETIFTPLGMSSAGVEGAGLAARDIADSYAIADAGDRTSPSPFGNRAHVRDDGLVNLSAGRDHYNAWAHAAGAVALPAADLARFMRAVRENRFTIFRDQAASLASAAERPRSFFDWNGGSRGIQATILYAVAPAVTVIVIENSSNAGTGSHDLAKALLDVAREPAE